MRVSVSVLAVLTLSQVAQGYGILGHTLTGQVAQLLLTPETARQVKEILSPYYDGLLSKAAPWPDTIKMRPQYRWASVFHYVNTADDPPDDCHFDYSRDRHDVVNGIFNMTATLMHYKTHPPPPPPSRPPSSPRPPGGGSGMQFWEEDQEDQDEDGGMADRSIREDALRFFVHFLGDIHQPLHTTGKARGGNDAPARWRRAKSSLHKIWDSQLIMKDIQDNFDKDPKSYLDNIMEMTTSFWSPGSQNWTLCDPATIQDELADNPWATDLQNPAFLPSSSHHDDNIINNNNINSVLHHLCPKAWAREMNAMACKYAWYGYLGPEGDHSQGEYYDRATGSDNGFLVRQLIAKSGVRMAAVLNAIYDPTYAGYGLPSPTTLWRWSGDRSARMRPQYQKTVQWLQEVVDHYQDSDDHCGGVHHSQSSSQYESLHRNHDDSQRSFVISL
ncbi:hypothetical protein BGW41_008126 [Actinomortierella wolfii]|nr:hypothetical protein BGW41_008126 [Actinomortierella wolfii]